MISIDFQEIIIPWACKRRDNEINFTKDINAELIPKLWNCYSETI